MRKLAVAIVFLVSTAAFAQEKPNGIYVFVANPGFAYSEPGGTSWNAAFGVALQRMFTPHLSGEVTVARDQHTSRVNAFDSNGNLLESQRFTNVFTPVDLTARYHFFTDGPWKPYAGLGVRYVQSRAFPDVTGGVVWQFRPSLGLRFDAKVLVGHQPRFSDSINAGAGLAWRF